MFYAYQISDTNASHIMQIILEKQKKGLNYYDLSILTRMIQNCFTKAKAAYPAGGSGL